MPNISSHNRGLTALPGGGYETVFIDASDGIEITGELGLPRDITTGTVAVLSRHRQLLLSVTVEGGIAESNKRLFLLPGDLAPGNFGLPGEVASVPVAKPSLQTFNSCLANSLT